MKSSELRQLLISQLINSYDKQIIKNVNNFNYYRQVNNYTEYVTSIQNFAPLANRVNYDIIIQINQLTETQLKELADEALKQQRSLPDLICSHPTLLNAFDIDTGLESTPVYENLATMSCIIDDAFRFGPREFSIKNPAQSIIKYYQTHYDPEPIKKEE